MCKFMLLLLSHLGCVRLDATLRLQPARLLCAWDTLGNSITVDCHSLLQGNLPDPWIEPRSPALQADSLLLRHQGSACKFIFAPNFNHLPQSFSFSSFYICHSMANRETMETVKTLFSCAPKSLQMVTAAMKSKRRLLLGRKAMANLDSTLESRDITLPTKVHLVKTMVCPVVVYGYESWTIKKAEHQIIDAFELWCWRRLLRVPWTARRSSQSILKEINPEYSLERLMLKLKLQYFGHLMRRADSFEKTLMLGKIEGRRRRG